VRVFLSYHSPDRAIARSLKSAIETAMPDTDVFLDNTHLRHGHFWQPALLDALATSDAFIILLSNHLGEWQRLEYYEAADRKAKEDDFVLLPVIIANRAVGAVPNLPGMNQLHWIEALDPTEPTPLSKIIAALGKAADDKPSAPWKTINPYRGLIALEEQDADFFFGREQEVTRIIGTIADNPGRLIALVGNSGVGKSSLVQAGVIAALKRQCLPAAQPWPLQLRNSRNWCFLTLKPGNDPVHALASRFVDIWYPDAADHQRISKRSEWAQMLSAGKAEMADLLDATDTVLATQLGSHSPERYFLYIDQGEELYSQSPAQDRKRFSQLIAAGLEARASKLTVMTSLRADYYGEFQANTPLFLASAVIDVAPLAAAALTRVLTEPAKILGARFEDPKLVSNVVEAAESEPGALPLLADLFADLWERMRERGDGTIRVSDRIDHAESLRIGASLARRAEQFLLQHPSQTEAIKRLFTLKLAHVPRQGEPVRARYVQEHATQAGEHQSSEWKLVELLSSPEWRLLVTGEADGKATAEIAHEILLRAWPSLKRWLDQERDFLVWRGELAAHLADFESSTTQSGASRSQALLMGLPLSTASHWLDMRRPDIDTSAVRFIEESQAHARRIQRNRQRLQASVVALLVAVIVGLVGWINQQFLKERWFSITNISGHTLTSQTERVLKGGEAFRECALSPGLDASSTLYATYSTHCPEMVVVPAGEFMMGGPGAKLFIPPVVATQKLSLEGTDKPRTEDVRDAIAVQQHKVVFARPFAVSKFEVTAEQWQACVDFGGCVNAGSIGKEPATSMSWNEAQDYVRWLSRVTGATYRLLTEAEWEYAARAGTQTAFFWGDEVGVNNANCRTCGSQWDFTRSSPVGSFKPNAFGLYDMHGNVWEWCEDVYHDTYEGAPTDGTAWMKSGDDRSRVIRSASWYHRPINLKSDVRNWFATGNRTWDLGFRVARTLDAHEE
jgi:formylglycine-generating enzyme required for sulfatase activity